MNDFVFLILKIIVIISVSFITMYIVPAISKYIKSKENDELMRAVITAVKAAEQTIRESGQGEVKKEKVENWLHDWLDEHNIYITDEQLEQLIEAAVYSMNHPTGSTGG